MPLSEEELRLLEQMERALVQEDPKFASTMRGARQRRAHQRNLALSGVFFLGGVALLMTGVVSALWGVGLIGFLVMLGSATLGLNVLRGRSSPVLVQPTDWLSASFRGIRGRRSRRGW